MRRVKRRLRDAYRFPGFVPSSEVHGFFGDPRLRVVSLRRHQKKACGQCGCWCRSFYDRRPWVVRDLSCGLLRIYLELELRRVACPKCEKVKRERLTWLADNPFYTK